MNEETSECETRATSLRTVLPVRSHRLGTISSARGRKIGRFLVEAVGRASVLYVAAFAIVAFGLPWITGKFGAADHLTAWTPTDYYVVAGALAVAVGILYVAAVFALGGWDERRG